VSPVVFSPGFPPLSPLMMLIVRVFALVFSALLLSSSVFVGAVERRRVHHYHRLRAIQCRSEALLTAALKSSEAMKGVASSTAITTAKTALEDNYKAYLLASKDPKGKAAAEKALGEAEAAGRQLSTATMSALDKDTGTAKAEVALWFELLQDCFATFNVETLMYLMHVKKFKEAETAKKPDLAKKIMDLYIKENAKLEINIDAEISKAIKTEFKGGDWAKFLSKLEDAAKHVRKTLLEQKAFPSKKFIAKLKNKEIPNVPKELIDCTE